MEKPFFYTDCVNATQTQINMLITDVCRVMVDDIKTALENKDDAYIELDEHVYLPYTNNTVWCNSIWLDDDDVCFGFHSDNYSKPYVTKRRLNEITFEFLNHVYNTLQNEGWFNPDNYIHNTEEHEQELVEILLPDSCARFPYIQ